MKLYTHTYVHMHTRIKIFSNAIINITFFLRRQTAMKIQKEIATVLCIYIFLMNASTNKAFNTITAPIRFFSVYAQNLSYKIYRIYRASRITLLCIIFLVIVRL